MQRGAPHWVALRSGGANYIHLVIKWEPDESRGYVYVQMADHITARIDDGDLPVGARLPGERGLAEEYGVSLDTTRRALESLRKSGLVETVASKGTYVRGR